MPSIKVIIADDSVVYRSQVKAAVSLIPNMEILGTAANGRIALDKLKQNAADLLILDLEMPEMNGLETLVELSKLNLPTKVLVFSSASKRGADITIEALRLGAKDFVTKPDGKQDALIQTSNPADTIRTLLEPKIQALFSSNFEPKPLPSGSVKNYAKVIWELFRPKVVVIGSSTGGPTALEKLLRGITPPLEVPILITQHMPPIFTASLAEQIQKQTGIPTKEGADGEALKAGTIYIAPGDFHMTLQGTTILPTIKLDKSPLINSVRPAVDLLFSSAANIFGKHTLGVVLTGMGHDGRSGSQDIKALGGAVLIQDRESCVVYGMPGSVEEVGAFDKIQNLENLSRLLSEKITQAGIQQSIGAVSHA